MPEEKPRVLYVEDHDDTRLMVKFMLRANGLEMTGVDNGRECLNQLSHEQFDLVILDHTIPDLSGPELCRAIRQRDSQIPIVFYSGRDLMPDIEDAMDAGANDYLVKPSDTDHLPERVWQFIRERQARREVVN